MKGEMSAKQSDDAVADALRGRTVRGARRAERMIAANVTDEEYEIIQAHAKRGGYVTEKRQADGAVIRGVPVIADYIRAVAVSPMPKYDTDAARISRPLIQIADKIRRVLDVLDRNETDAVRGYLAEMQNIIHSALTPLRSEHDTEVRSAE